MFVVTMPCVVCHKAKQKGLPFPSNNNLSSKAFDLIHIDSWGPFRVPTIDGYRCFLTLVDDRTRATWVYLMKSKLDALTLFPSFYTFIQTHYHTPIKAARSDNAPELTFHEFFFLKGIKSFHSCVET